MEPLFRSGNLWNGNYVIQIMEVYKFMHVIACMCAYACVVRMRVVNV